MKKQDAATDRSSCTSFMEEAVGVGSQESATSTMDDGRWTMRSGSMSRADQVVRCFRVNGSQFLIHIEITLLVLFG
jgi:hypothetical protein